VTQPPVVFRPYPPWVVGAGSLGASSWPQIRRWDRRRCCRRISGPPGGPETRWILSVGWCPSKRVVVIHCARPYTAHKVSGGCVTAISGSASKYGGVARYECLSSDSICLFFVTPSVSPSDSFCLFFATPSVSPSDSAFCLFFATPSISLVTPSVSSLWLLLSLLVTPFVSSL
jgi:hypothetical protein